MTALLAWLLLRLAPKPGPAVRIIPAKPQGWPQGHRPWSGSDQQPSPDNIQTL